MTKRGQHRTLQKTNPDKVEWGKNTNTATLELTELVSESLLVQTGCWPKKAKRKKGKNLGGLNLFLRQIKV